MDKTINFTYGGWATYLNKNKPIIYNITCAKGDPHEDGDD